MNLAGIGLGELANYTFVRENLINNDHLLAVRENGSLTIIEKKTVNCWNTFLAFFGFGKLKGLSYTIRDVKDAVWMKIEESGKANEIWRAVNDLRNGKARADLNGSDETIIKAIVGIQESVRPRAPKGLEHLDPAQRSHFIAATFHLRGNKI